VAQAEAFETAWFAARQRPCKYQASSGKGLRYPCLASEAETFAVSLRGKFDFVSDCKIRKSLACLYSNISFLITTPIVVSKLGSVPRKQPAVSFILAHTTAKVFISEFSPDRRIEILQVSAYQRHSLYYSPRRMTEGLRSVGRNRFSNLSCQSSSPSGRKPTSTIPCNCSMIDGAI
jgi:hypothetical protein